MSSSLQSWIIGKPGDRWVEWVEWGRECKEMAGYIQTAKTVEWGTPPALFKALHAEFDFNLDAAASEHNALVSNFFSEKKRPALDQKWLVRKQIDVDKGRVFCNPPYGRVLNDWLAHGHKQVAEGHAEFIVWLLPVRPDTRWFHSYVLGQCEIRLIKGRLKYGGCENPAGFPSMVVVMRPERVTTLAACEQSGPIRPVYGISPSGERL